MICSRHTLDWLVPYKSARARPWKRLMVGTATIVMLSYVTIGLVCAGTEGMHVRLPGADELAPAKVASESPAPDTDDELCKFVHEQILTLQATSTGSIVLASVLHLGVPPGEDLAQQTPILAAFRPPGLKRTPAEILSFQLYSVLRI